MIQATNAAPALAHSSTNQLRDIKPPIYIASAWTWVWLGLGLLLLAAVALWAWNYWDERRRNMKLTPPVPAHVIARQKLEQALALIGRPKEFCTLVSDTIRWYLEERFEFRAPERTTEEFLYELQNTNLLNADQKASLSEFLQRCDLVKFAKYEPAEPELRDLHASALRLVSETEPRPAATEAAATQPSTSTPG